MEARVRVEDVTGVLGGGHLLDCKEVFLQPASIFSLGGLQFHKYLIDLINFYLPREQWLLSQHHPPHKMQPTNHMSTDILVLDTKQLLWGRGPWGHTNHGVTFSKGVA